MRFEQIRVVDITDDLIKNDSIVPKTERQPNQTSLTLVQYLRAVIPWTVAHKDIAPERIAGHLINSWKGMVGQDLANKFPALAAFSFIANDRVDIHTERGFKKSLSKQERFVADEHPEERIRLEKALCAIAEIIRQSQLRAPDVERSAHSLIGTKSAVIGGAKETHEQIFGLLRSVAFENKLNREFRDRLAEAARIRLEFAKTLEETFTRLADHLSGNDTEWSEVKKALNDISLSMDQTLQIITAKSPRAKYNEITQNLNKLKLERYYGGTNKKQILSQDEKTMINNLGNITHLEETGIPSMADDIRTSATILHQSREWQEKLRDGLEDFVRRGVSKETVEKAITSMSQRQETVLTADSMRTLSDRTKQLQTTVAEFQEKVGREILQFEVGQQVSKLMAEELKANKNPHFQARIVWAIMQDKSIDATDNSAVTRWIQGFKTLNQHIQDEVLLGSMPLVAAVRVHRSTKSAAVPPAAEQPPVVVPVAPKPLPIIEGQPQVSPEEIRRRRIERNIERLQREVIEEHIEPMIRVLATLDLTSEEVPLLLKKILGEGEILLERLRSGHPDIVRMVDKTYPELREENIRLRGIILEIQRQQASRDTYSGQNS